MAQPISLEVAPRDAREELRRRLECAPEAHAEAILAAFELLQEMHERGLLDLARGVLSTQDEILETLARNASTPEALRAIRNLLSWWRILGRIETGCFQPIFEAIPEGITLATSPRAKPVTLLGLLRRLTSKESLRALAAATDFLQTFGQRLLATEKNAPRNRPQP